MRDRGFCKKGLSTKTLTLQSYVNLYSGPEVTIHFRYANIINQVYVAFTHGLALPMLFPIAMFGLFNIYVIERLQFAYFYREPPTFDNKFNDRALKILFYAPIMMLLNGYWLLSNRQMFHNEQAKISYQNTPVLTEHKPFDYSNGPDYTILILLAIPLFATLRTQIHLFHRLGLYLGIFKKFSRLDDNWQFVKVNENIGNYYQSLSGLDQKRLYCREIHTRHSLNMKTMSNENLAILGSCSRAHQQIKGCVTYDVINNLNYTDKIFYTLMEKRNIAFLTETSDHIFKILYMGEEMIVDPLQEENSHLQEIERLMIKTNESVTKQYRLMNGELNSKNKILNFFNEDFEGEFEFEFD